MSTDTIPAPSVETLRREIDSDSNGMCRVCGALREWICDAVVHKQARASTCVTPGLIYLVMIDGSKLTDPQQHRRLEKILRLGAGASEVAGELRASVPPVPLKWNAVDVPFEAVLERIGEAVDALIAEHP